MRTVLIVPRVDVDMEDESAEDLAEQHREIETHPRGNGDLEPGVAEASEAKLERVLGW